MNSTTQTPALSQTDKPTMSTSSKNSGFRVLCRCDEGNVCLDRALPRGVALRMCIFAPDSKEVVGMKFVELVQGNNTEVLIQESKIVNSTDVLLSFNGTGDDMCIVQTPIKRAFFDDSSFNSLSVRGVVELAEEGQDGGVRGSRLKSATSTQIDVEADVALDRTGYFEGVLSVEYPTIVEERGNYHEIRTGESLTIWLAVPLLVFLLASCSYIFLIFRRRKVVGAPSE